MITRKHMTRVVALLALGAWTPAPLAAQDSLRPMFKDERRYESCIKLTRRAPEQAYEDARAWESFGGGPPARHCVALALIAMGQYQDGAELLEAVALDLPTESNPAIKAELLAQAGQAWGQTGDLEKAAAAQTAALEVAPDNPDILIDRAMTLALAKNYWEAIDDLNAALELRPEDADALVLRASAYRFVDVTDLALEDVNAALYYEPDHPEGLLERGNLKRLTGDIEGARADWLRLVEVHGGRPAADAAQLNLQALEVSVE